MASIPTIRAAFDKEAFARGWEGIAARDREALECQPTGIAKLDALLRGGIPRGSLVELYGRSSSGRTGLCLSLLAQATGEQQTCAFVDVSDSLDPMSLAAAGVDLTRLLWVRCGDGESTVPRSDSLPRSRPGHVRNEKSPQQPRKTNGGGCGWRHPRDQVRGIETAIPSMMRNGDRRNGAQETTERNVAARCAGEQVERDRELPRRGENVRRLVGRREHDRAASPPNDRPNVSGSRKPWKDSTGASDDRSSAAQWGMGCRGARLRKCILGRCAANSSEYLVSLSTNRRRNTRDIGVVGRRALREELRIVGPPLSPEK